MSGGEDVRVGVQDVGQIHETAIRPGWMVTHTQTRFTHNDTFCPPTGSGIILYQAPQPMMSEDEMLIKT